MQYTLSTATRFGQGNGRRAQTCGDSAVARANVHAPGVQGVGRDKADKDRGRGRGKGKTAGGGDV